MITSEKLKKVEELYHEVLDLPRPDRNRFLQDSCGEDVELRNEVESLLSFEGTTDELIDSSPEVLIKEVFAESSVLSLIGRKINQYKIISLLGEGGMGAVFLAQDTKLERKVAVKFLSDKFPKEGNGLNRFFLEAKSSSALNHPNIITVHEIGDYDGKPFIATEFIDGITLKDYLASGKTTLSEIINISVQTASALSSAHKAGIIHRDIKPDNVMIRQDGIVKVLDFGLAKLNRNSEVGANPQTNLSTIHGIILGTPQFMSPEQARGKKVDTRTDIWSFGVLLYQMLTGKLPFNGETTSDVIAAVLKSEPKPLTDYYSHISPQLEHITLKCLEKQRNERYQSFDEILPELKSLRHNLESEFEIKTEQLDFRTDNRIISPPITNLKQAQITAEQTNYHPSKISVIFSQTVKKARQFPIFASFILVAVISVIAGFGLGISKLTFSENQTDTFGQMKLSKITFDGTATNIVAVSPDGKYVVYALKKEEKQTLMLRQVATSSTVQLVPEDAVSYEGLTFSQDGNFIYYTLNGNKKAQYGKLFVIPTLGGTPRIIADDVSGKITFSPDGKMIAFVRSQTSLMIADINGSSQRVLAKSEENDHWRIVEWKPDGSSILSSVYSAADTKLHLSEISVTNGSQKRLSAFNWLAVNGLTWLKDGSGIILGGRDSETKFSQLWFVPYPSGEPRKITNDFSSYLGLSITADNKSLVAVKEERLYNIWFLSDGKTESSKKLTSEEGRDEGNSGMSQTPDGKIAYTARVAGTIDIWTVNADGGGNRQLTFNQGSNYSPAVSPDGESIVFISNRAGNQDFWRMDIDGGNQTKITDTPESEGNPNFTPDGKSLIYHRTDEKRTTTVWKSDANGENPVQITETETNRPGVSPDGKFIACDYDTGKPDNLLKLAVYSIDGGKPLKILDLPKVIKSRTFRWTNDGEALIYVDGSNRTQNLWKQTLDGKPPTQLTFFESGQIARFNFAADGKSLILSRGNDSSDVVLFGNFR